MPRGPRLDFPGALHHITVRGWERRHIFDRHCDKRAFLRRLRTAFAATRCRCHAWCIMDNHAHFLIESGGLGVSALWRSCLTSYSLYFNRSRTRVGHVFQNRFNSRLCTDEAYFKEAICYIHLNPVKAGLVPSVNALAAYPWTGHPGLLGHRPFEWQDIRLALAAFDRTFRNSRSTYLFALNEKAGAKNYTLPKRKPLRFPAIFKSDGERWHLRERITAHKSQVKQIFLKSSFSHEGPVNLALRGWNLSHLAKFLAGHYQLPVHALTKRGRSNGISRARHALAWLAHTRLDIPRHEILGFLNISTGSLSRMLRRASLDPDIPNLPSTLY